MQEKINSIHPHFLLKMDMLALKNYIWQIASDELKQACHNNPAKVAEHYFRNYVDEKLFHDELFDRSKFNPNKREKLVYLFALGFKPGQLVKVTSSSPNYLYDLYKNDNWFIHREFKPSIVLDRITRDWQPHREKLSNDIFFRYLFK